MRARSFFFCSYTLLISGGSLMRKQEQWVKPIGRFSGVSDCSCMQRQLIVALVQLGGLEPPTSCSTDRRSNQLSYNCILASRASGRALRGPST